MALLPGEANRLVDVYHKSFSQNNSGGMTETWTKAVSDLPCRIDHRGGQLLRLLQGEQTKDSQQLYCDYRTDLREGDKITNIRILHDDGVTVETMQDWRNGSQVNTEFVVKHIHNPGSETDHLEIDLESYGGQAVQ